MLKNMSYKVESTDLKQVIHTSDYANKNKLTNVVGKSVLLISPSPCVKNLGSWFDSNISMTDHINKACNAAFYHYIT